MEYVPETQAADVLKLQEEVQRLRNALANAEVRNATLEPLRLANTISSSALGLHSFLQDILKRAVAIVGAEAGSLLLLDEKSNELEFAVVYGGGGAKLIGTRMPADTGIAGWVAMNQQPLVVNDPNNNSHYYSEISTQYAYPSFSLVCVPLIAKGKVIGVLEAINKNGDKKFENLDVSLLLAFAGQVAMAIERKQAEENLRHERDFLNNLVDNAPVIVLVLDNNGRIISFNQHMELLVGYQLDEVQGKDWFNLFSPLDVIEQNRQALLGFDKNLPCDSWVGVINTKSGQRREIEWHRSAFRENGNITGILAIGQDVTDRLYSEKLRTALYEISQAALDADDLQELFGFIQGIIFNLMPVQHFGIALLQNGNKFSFAYLADDKGIAISPSDFIIHATQTVVDSDESLLTNSVVKDSKGHGYSYLGVPLRLKRGTIGVLAVESQADQTTYCYSTEDENILAFVSTQVAMAIERKQAEDSSKKAQKDLQQMAQELARSNAELEQFAYVASHDLQEPLRTVESYVQLIARRYEGKLDANADEFINFAVDGTKRMQALINDLLDFSRVQTRGREFRQIESEIILKRALSNLQTRIDEEQAVITYDPLPIITCDSSQMIRVFQNLLGNAVKFKGDRIPRIHVSAQRTNGNWLFAFEDNGIGLEKEFQERIFQIFQRLHTRAEYPGNGIGLAVCKKIIERHNGRIWVESEPDIGSTFYFTLPVLEGK